MYVAIGTSPFTDTSVAVGPFRSRDKADEAYGALTERGYVVEVCELLSIADIEYVTNEEE